MDYFAATEDAIL